MLNFQDLPDELILKIFGYSEIKDIIIYGQVSRRLRRISHDGRLWVTANLVMKIVKSELLEMILSKGCKILNISYSTIVGSLSSNIKSQVRALDLSQSAWCDPGPNYTENIGVFEELLFLCCSLNQLKMEGINLTPKMVASICKNGKTLQVLHLNHSYVGEYIMHHGNFQSIIKSCQELKEVNLDYINGKEGLSEVDLEFFAKNITTNIEKLNLVNPGVDDDQVKLLLSRCNKIRELSLDAYIMTDDSLTYIRQYLNLTLEELSLVEDDDISFTGFLELKSMPRLKLLNLYHKKDKEIQNLRQHLPHLNLSRLWGEWLSMI